MLEGINPLLTGEPRTYGNALLRKGVVGHPSR